MIPSHNAQDGSRTYVHSKSKNRWHLALAGFFFLMGLAMFALALDVVRLWAMFAGFGVFLTTIAALAYRQARRFRLVLHPDRIHVRGVFDKTILRGEIAGYRLDEQYGMLRLIGRQGRVLTSIELSGALDSEFERWFSEIPDLDTRDFVEVMEATRQADPSRPSPEQFVASIQKAQRLLRWLGLGSLSVCLWFALYPQPYLPLFVFAGLVPPISVVVHFAFPNRVRFETMPGLLGIDLVILMASVALVARVLPDAHPLEWRRVALSTAVLTVLLDIVVYRMVSKNKLKTSLVFSLFTASYSCGLVALGNQVFDRQVVWTADIRVMEMKGSPEGRGPCAIMAARADGSLGRYGTNCASLAHIKVGQWLRIDLFEGAFGIPWWRWAH